MSAFNDYKDSAFYRFVEKTANFCTALVSRIVDWVKRRGQVEADRYRSFRTPAGTISRLVLRRFSGCG